MKLIILAIEQEYKAINLVKNVSKGTLVVRNIFIQSNLNNIKFIVMTKGTIIEQDHKK